MTNLNGADICDILNPEPSCLQTKFVGMANNSENVREDINKLLTIIKKLKDNIDEISSWLHSEFAVVPPNIQNILSSCEDLYSESFSDSPLVSTLFQENPATSEKGISSTDKTDNSDLDYDVNENDFENGKNSLKSSDIKEEDFGVNDEYLSDDNHDNDPLEGLCPYSSLDNGESKCNLSEEEFQLDNEIFDADLKSSCYQSLIEKFNPAKKLVIILQDINAKNGQSRGEERTHSEKRKSGRRSTMLISNSLLKTTTSDWRKINYYKCNTCQKVFQTESARKNHENQSHDESKPFHCHYKRCQRAFVTRSAFGGHLRNDHPEYYATVREEPFYKKDRNNGHVCGKCFKSFSTLEECNSHIFNCRRPSKSKIRKKYKRNPQREAAVDNIRADVDEDIDGNPFPCPKCKTRCATRELLNKHLFNFCYRCKSCQRPFSLKKTRDEHMVHCETRKERKKKVSKVMKSLSCELCQTNYTEQKDLEHHMTTSHQVKAFNCVHSHCKRRFATEAEVDDHESKLHCQMCAKHFPHLAHFTIHNNKIHTGQASTSTIDKSNDPRLRDFENAFQCSKCGKLFTKILNFKIHLEEGCLDLGCNICGRKLPSGTNLEQHLKTHTNERSYLCNSCGGQFIRKSDLERHIRTQHETNREKFECKLCDKTYVTMPGYTRHMKTHDAEGVPRIPCNLCEYDFSSSRSLKIHIQAVHENRRPYPCHLCDKRFKCTSARKYHIKTHDNPNGRKRGLNKDVGGKAVGSKRRRKPPKSETNDL